ncbi:MAG: hypothetical protein Q8L02_04275 [Candidatus Nitrotoga sp.]|nr:hypothetical protein [Candidatus Nitrotoga sp.]
MTSTCVPGMARNYAGGSTAARFSQGRRLEKRQRRCHEALEYQEARTAAAVLGNSERRTLCAVAYRRLPSFEGSCQSL